MPFVASIDAGITQNAAGTASLGQSLRESASKAMKNPVTFLRSPPCRWLGAVYCGTYLAVNVTDTYCEWSGRSSVLPILAASTVANGSLSIAKDAAFAKLFGAIASAPVPAASYGFWFTRDILSMAFIFTLPPLITPHIQRVSENLGWGLSPAMSGLTAQLASPVVCQIFSTALHLGGLDYYNNRNVPVADRMRMLKKNYVKTLGARSLRIFFPFSIGSVLNKNLRGLREAVAVHPPS